MSINSQRSGWKRYTKINCKTNSIYSKYQLFCLTGGLWIWGQPLSPVLPLQHFWVWKAHIIPWLQLLWGRKFILIKISLNTTITNLILCALCAVSRSGSLGIVILSLEYPEFWSRVSTCKNIQIYRPPSCEPLSCHSINTILCPKEFNCSCCSNL